ncbi:hypothetical protein Leryth_006518 [Lithospermum erythrorhizon]|uniref:Amino acid transporter transmembrane domain-containing protein n=1 Tax=Lithospermum erythrorhizon TaxID=34254 RepID=A0AAV3PVN4_LITER|nr:hypothetical protein Leryth_006518 [Lithospermum erythrorhizon]
MWGLPFLTASFLLELQDGERRSYSTIAWGASAHKGIQETVSYNPRASTGVGKMFQFFSALGDVAFAYAGHNVVLLHRNNHPKN